MLAALCPMMPKPPIRLDHRCRVVGSADLFFSERRVVVISGKCAQNLSLLTQLVNDKGR